MLTFALRRLSAAAFMLAVAMTIIFSLIHILPGDPVLLLLGDQAAADPKVVASIRAKLHLDLPIAVQYADWVVGLFRLDLGQSLQSGVAVRTELARRVPRSLELIVAGLLLATVIGVPLGIVGAQRRDTPAGWSASVIAALGFSSPIFVSGIILIIVFSLWGRLLPSSGYVRFSENPSAHVGFLILPALTLALNFMGVVIRMTRASLLDVLTKEYIRTARAKGLPATLITYRHALRNALIPVIAVIGVRAGNLLGGTVILESLFNWPGLSSLLVRACYDRDYPLIQGALLAIFVMFILISIAIDLLHVIIDPRLRRV